MSAAAGRNKKDPQQTKPPTNKTPRPPRSHAKNLPKNDQTKCVCARCETRRVPPRPPTQGCASKKLPFLSLLATHAGQPRRQKKTTRHVRRRPADTPTRYVFLQPHGQGRWNAEHQNGCHITSTQRTLRARATGNVIGHRTQEPPGRVFYRIVFNDATVARGGFCCFAGVPLLCLTSSTL